MRRSSSDPITPPPAAPRRRRGDRPPYRDRGLATRSPAAAASERAALDCAAALPFAEALAVDDGTIRDGLVGIEDLVEAAEQVRGPGARRVRRVAREANGDAANSFESALRAAVLDTGITGFRPQQPVVVAGVTRYVDLGDERRRIALEADSFAYHGSRAALRNDCRRYDELVRIGRLVPRFAWEHVVLEPDWVGAVVRDTCALRDRAA